MKVKGLIKYNRQMSWLIDLHLLPFSLPRNCDEKACNKKKSERNSPRFKFRFVNARAALCVSPPLPPSPSPTSRNPNPNPNSSPLSSLLCHFSSTRDDQNHAGMALYHLTFHCPSNAMKLATVEGAVSKLVAVAARRRGSERAVAMITVMCNLAGVAVGGREVLMDAGAVERMVEVGRGEEEEGGGEWWSCWLSLMYEMCRYSLNRFREGATRAGAASVLGKDREEWGSVGREMARVMVKVVRGEWVERVKMKPSEWEIEEEEEEEEEEYVILDMDVGED